MAVNIMISSKQSCPRLKKEGRIQLEEDVEDFLGDIGEVGEGGSGSMGWDTTVWNVDEDDLEDCLERLAGFLRQWGVPSDTILTVHQAQGPDDESSEEQDNRVVPVFPGAS